MALAVSLLPKVLRPVDGEFEEDLINPGEVVPLNIEALKNVQFVDLRDLDKSYIEKYGDKNFTELLHQMRWNAIGNDKTFAFKNYETPNPQ